MPQANEGTSQPLSWVLALLALLVTGAAAFVASQQLSFEASLGVALLAGLLLEFRSTALSAAGYFSLASPIYILMAFVHGPGTPVSTPLGALGVSVAVAGICGIGRLAGGGYPLSTRLQS